MRAHADTGRERRAIQQCPACLWFDGEHDPKSLLCRPRTATAPHTCPTCGGTVVRCANCKTTFDPTRDD
jgi:hypothetical protein